MIDAFSTAVGTALTAFVADVEGAITANTPTVLGVALGLVGLFLVWRVIKKLASAR